MHTDHYWEKPIGEERRFVQGSGMTEGDSWKGLSRKRKAARIVSYAMMFVGVIFMAALSRTWSWYAFPIGIAILVCAALFAVSIDNRLKKQERSQ
jgi:uncharacterized membrane protein YoaK (UPF0700 family)